VTCLLIVTKVITVGFYVDSATYCIQTGHDHGELSPFAVTHFIYRAMNTPLYLSQTGYSIMNVETSVLCVAQHLHCHTVSIMQWFTNFFPVHPL